MVKKNDREKLLRLCIDRANRLPSILFTLDQDALKELHLSNPLNTIKVLESLGFLNRVDNNREIIEVRLTPSGYTYFEQKSDNRREFWYRSIFVSIGVSIVTSVIIQSLISWITP